MCYLNWISYLNLLMKLSRILAYCSRTMIRTHLKQSNKYTQSCWVQKPLKLRESCRTTCSWKRNDPWLTKPFNANEPQHLLSSSRMISQAVQLHLAEKGKLINNCQNLNMKDQESYSSGKHSSQSEEEKHYERKEKVEKPLKVKLPKHKHQFTVIGKFKSLIRDNFLRW